MARLTNRTRRDIPLPSRHVIPRKGTLTLPNAVIRGDNWAMLNGLALAGDIALELDPEPAAEDGETTTVVIDVPQAQLPGATVKPTPPKA